MLPPGRSQLEQWRGLVYSAPNAFWQGANQVLDWEHNWIIVIALSDLVTVSLCAPLRRAQVGEALLACTS
jgi:hypothetical protein